MKLRLNLSTTPLENKRPFAAAATVLGAVGLLTFLLLAHAAYTSWRANRQLRSEISHWQSEIRANRQKQAELDAGRTATAGRFRSDSAGAHERPNHDHRNYPRQ